MLSCPDGCVSEASIEPPGIDDDEPVFLSRLKRVHRVLIDCRNPNRCWMMSDSLTAVATGSGSWPGIRAGLKAPRYVGAGRGRGEMPWTDSRCWREGFLVGRLVRQTPRRPTANLTGLTALGCMTHFPLFSLLATLCFRFHYAYEPGGTDLWSSITANFPRVLPDASTLLGVRGWRQATGLGLTLWSTWLIRNGPKAPSVYAMLERKKGQSAVRDQLSAFKPCSCSGLQDYNYISLNGSNENCVVQCAARHWSGGWLALSDGYPRD